jgi:hypothetical protein
MLKAEKSSFLSRRLLFLGYLIAFAICCLFATVMLPQDSSALADNEMVFEVNFQKYSGGAWVLQEYDELPISMMYVEHSPGDATTFEEAKKYNYTINYSNGNQYSRGVEEGGFIFGEVVHFLRR